MAGAKEALTRMAKTLVVGESDRGRRLDAFLQKHAAAASRAGIRQLIKSGAVSVNGRPADKGRTLWAGDVVRLERDPPPRDFIPKPVHTPLVIRLETERFVIVDKPAGWPSHPLQPTDEPTVVGALLARYPEMAGVGYAERESGLVHRLDNDTSGLLLAARDALAFERLSADLRAGKIAKRYIALVHGIYAGPKTLSAPLAPDRRSRMRVVTARRGPGSRGRIPTTYIDAAHPADGCTWLSVRASVAVRHQIRAHLAWVGHPLVGDTRYGAPKTADGRHVLHASELALHCPFSGQPYAVHSPFPARPSLPRLPEAFPPTDTDARGPKPETLPGQSAKYEVNRQRELPAGVPGDAARGGREP